MKSYMLKLAGLATLSAFIVTGSFAQAPKKTKQYSKHSDDVLIIRQKVDKDSKITIEMKGGDVLVNGKPISEFKDDNIIISKRKELTGPFGEVGIVRGDGRRGRRLFCLLGHLQTLYAKKHRLSSYQFLARVQSRQR